MGKSEMAGRVDVVSYGGETSSTAALNKWPDGRRVDVVVSYAPGSCAVAR